MALVVTNAPWAAANEFTPAVSVADATPVAEGEDIRPGIIAGQDAVYQLSVRNDNGGAQYNTSITALVPNDVHFVEGDALLREPVVYVSGKRLPDNAGDDGEVPEGYQLWVWENVADLPQGAVLDPTFTVRPNAGVFPVGAQIDIGVNAYTSSSPNLLPTFPGSSSVATDAGHTSGEGSGDVATPVGAVRIHKSEPSPENELLRGVHDHSTTYTLRVLYTGEGDTQPITVTDYLPAGLEYLGGGGIDNTQDSENLYDGNREYPEAGSLDATPEPAGGGHRAEDAVKTVELSNEDAEALGLGENAGGVYTKVTWTLPQADERDSGDAQQWGTSVGASAPGTPGEYVIRYRAAVPLFENTMDFDGGTPAPELGEQAANLNNNNGPSTRHGAGSSEHTDATSYTNVAVVNGDYQGDLADGAEIGQSDSSIEVIDAVDLRILKSAEPDVFVTDNVGTYTLELATSEYTSASDIVITDVIDNGICPVLPGTDGIALELRDADGVRDATPAVWNAAVPGPGCAYPGEAGQAELEGATLTGLLFDETDGSFTITLSVGDIAADVDPQLVSYTARASSSYTVTDSRDGLTSSGDSVTNNVDIRATTHAIDDLEGVKNSNGVAADGPQTVLETSSATVGSEFSNISKKVLQRGAGDPLTASDNAWVDEADDGFILGDTVWYRLRVEFPENIVTRNPVVTDFLPQGVELTDANAIVYRDGGDDASSLVASGPGEGTSLRWELGEDMPNSDGNRSVPEGTVLDIFLPVTVTGLSASAAEQDMPQNLMKFQQENTEGEVFFQRDDAAITIEHGATLLKGVASVDGEPGRPEGGWEFSSDRDGIEVVQGERVTYRLDITAPAFETKDYAVWDVLPEGITSDDIDDTSFVVTADGVDVTEFDVDVLTPGASDYPDVGADYDERDVIVWGIPEGIEPGAELTLYYDTIVPDGALVTQRYDNRAGIASYSGVTNQPGDDDVTVTYVPDGPFNRQAGEGEHEISGVGTYDNSWVYLPAPEMSKAFTSSEIGATQDEHNADNAIVQGEYATFTYSVTLPANTTVDGAILADASNFTFGTNGTVDYTPVGAELVMPETGLPDGFTLSDDGELTFPASYDVGTEDETFTVELTVWVDDADASNPERTPDLGHGTALTNTASFTHNPPAGGQDTWQDAASVTYIEPDIAISKSADPHENVEIGTDVTYTIEVTNASGRPMSYDTEVVDNVPAGLNVISVGNDGTAVENSGTGGTTITWPAFDLEGGETRTFTYIAQISPDTGGAETYLNEVDVTGYTLPDTPGTDRDERRGDRVAEDNATITAIDADITKGVQIAGTEPDDFSGSVSVPVGETVEYEVEVTLHPNINYWDPVITDTLPAGVVIQDVISGPAESTETGTITGDWTYELSDENVATWTYDGDIMSDAAERTLHLSYEALVTDSVVGGSLPNTADFSWNRVNEGDDETRESVEDDAIVNLLHPDLVIGKTVNEADSDTVEPGEAFTYRLLVTNDGNTPAYNGTVVDEVPEGVVVDESSITSGGELTDHDAALGGGTITWTFDGPLYQSGDDDPQQFAVSYRGTLADSPHIGSGQEFENTAVVQSWESFEDEGRRYGPSDSSEALVTPLFPDIELEKTPDGETAYAGEPFTWTLSAQNVGGSAANVVEITDTLPVNWEYTSTTHISVAGTNLSDDLEPARSGGGDEREVLTWTFEGNPVLQPGATITIAFTATPTDAALADAGVTHFDPEGNRVEVPHTNTLAATWTDVTNSPENGDGDYSADPDEASAFIHSADLVLEKDAGELLAGQTGTGWTITVSNAGPDTAVGPFTVTDTTGQLPEGVVVTGVSGTGWVSGPIERGADGVTTIELWRADPAETLEAGESFPDIEVVVQTAADVEPVSVLNSAEVTSDGTHDPDTTNNDDNDPLEITAAADLAIAKVLNTAEPNAGSAITWQLNPSNEGPSVSRSVEEPITITDVVPDGIDGVTVEPGDDWTAAIDGGGDFPATAGDTIVFTYTGDVMPVGDAGSITLSGVIDASWPAGESLSNTAVIGEGDTPDPGEENNTSTVTTTPGTDTMLDIAKTRVVEGDDGWETATEAPVAGEPVSYLVTVANLGPADAQNVTVVDDLPEYLAYSSFESVEGTWELTGGGDSGAQRFALTDPTALAPEATASFVITANLASGHTGNVVNAAQADAENSTNEPEDEDSSSSTRDADLSIVKEHTGQAIAGDTLDYTLTVTNEGPSSSSGPIAIADGLPAGFSYEAGSAAVAVAGGLATQVEPGVDGQWLTWTVGDDDFALATGQTIVITLTAAIADDVPAQTALVNTATVDGPEDSNPNNNRDTDPTDVVTQAEMTIDKTVEDGPWVAGTEVEYTFTVTNAGPSAADAVVTDLWPAGLTGVSISGAGWECDDATCEFDAHPVGTTELTVVGLIDQAVNPGAELINTAELTWTDSRGSGEDSDTETIEVTALADLGLVKTAVDDNGEEITQATAGEQARFRLDVTNHGPSLAAAPITVVDTLPEGMSYQGLAGDSATFWDATANGQEVTFVLNDGGTPLAAGAQAPELTLIVHIDAGVPVTDEADDGLVNVASVTSNTPEPTPDPNPNEDDEPLRIVHAVDLEIAKSHTGDATIGENLSFDLLVTNHGPSTAENVTVTETIPAGLAYVDHDGSDDAWSQVGDAVVEDDGTTTVVFALDGTIAVGDEAPALVVRTTVTPEAYPSVTNVVQVDSPQPDRNPGNNEDDDPVDVRPDADLTIAKVTLTDSPHAGREISWQITPTNLGPAESVSTTANPITVTDTLPDGVVDVAIETGADWQLAAGVEVPAQGGDTITLIYVGADAMPEGDTAPITLTGTIESSFVGEITNSTEITPGSTPDRDEENNTDEVTDPVDDTTSLDVLKRTVDPDTGEASDEPVDVVPGTQVTYELTVTNTGSADAREVTLRDELPDGLTFASFASVDPAAWTSDTLVGASDVELALTGSLVAPDGEATVRITADVADDLALTVDDVTNAVTAGAENVPEDEWPTDEVTDPLDPSADLSITKSHTGAVVAGLPVQYTLLAENHGPSVSPGPITVTDVLPEGMSYVADSARVTDPAGQTAAAEPAVDEQQLTWVIDEIVVPVEGTFTVTFETLVAPDVPATDDPDTPALVNTAAVDGPVDDNQDNNEDEDPTTIIELTVVSIAKTVIGSGPFTAGTEVDFELMVTVAGPSIARDVVLSDVLPDGLSLVSIGEEGDGWAWDEGVGTRDTLALGEHVIPVTALIDQAVPAGETLTNTGVIEWTDSDGPKEDDDPEDIGVVTDGDLGIVKTAVDAEGAETDTAVAGGELRYTFEVTNHGPSQAVALIEITDELPEGVTFLEVVGDDGGWVVTQDGQELTFTHASPLAAGDTAPLLTIATELDSALADGAEQENTAAVESVGTDEIPGTPDSNPENNEDDAIVTVERAVDLAVEKAHEGEARIGDELTFDIAVRNAGPSEATDVVVTDTLPAGLTYVSATGEDWEVTVADPAEDGTTTVTATLDGPLGPGTDAPALQVTALVEAGAYPEVANVAEVSSTEPDENPEDNTSTDPVPVPAQADLAVVKTVGVDRLQVGEAAVYTLTVTNHGPTEHVGQITVADTLPTGLRATAVEGLDCELLEDGGAVECGTADNLAVGDSLTVTVEVDVLASAWTEESAEVANTATVTGTSEDPDPENNTSTVTTPVDPDVRFELEKTRAAVDDDAVDWTITVRSVGLNDAMDGVVAVDQLPAELRYAGVTSDAEVECAAEGRTVECLVAGPIPTGESVDLTIHTTTTQEDGSTVTNVAWLVDPATGEILPNTEDSAEHRTGGLSVTGAAVGGLALLALLLILGGVALRARTRVS